MEIEKRGGLFSDWNKDVRDVYMDPLHNLIQTLIEIPVYPPDITLMDVLKLREVAEGLDFDVGDLDLYDPRNFYEVHGKLMRLAVKKVEEELKPTNPLQEELNNIPRGWKDLEWNPQILKKKIAGEDDEHS